MEEEVALLVDTLLSLGVSSNCSLSHFRLLIKLLIYWLHHRCCCNGAASLLCERSHEQSAVSSDYPIIHDRCAKQVATLRKACIRVSEQFAFVMFPLLLYSGFIFETISRRCFEGT